MGNFFFFNANVALMDINLKKSSASIMMVMCSFKADRVLNKLDFLFNSKSKTNLVTLWKCNLYLEYYKIDLSFSIKLQ